MQYTLRKENVPWSYLRRVPLVPYYLSVLLVGLGHGIIGLFQRTSTHFYLGVYLGQPSVREFSRCIEDPLVDFGGYLLFGRIVFPVTYHSFPFSI